VHCLHRPATQSQVIGIWPAGSPASIQFIPPPPAKPATYTQNWQHLSSTTEATWRSGLCELFVMQSPTTSRVRSPASTNVNPPFGEFGNRPPPISGLGGELLLFRLNKYKRMVFSHSFSPLDDFSLSLFLWQTQSRPGKAELSARMPLLPGPELEESDVINKNVKRNWLCRESNTGCAGADISGQT
jgi:hypothetical protein